VTVIDRTMQRIELVQLMSSCNAWLVEHRQEAGRLVQKAQDNIRRHYSSRAVAEAYRLRLRELRQAHLI